MASSGQETGCTDMLETYVYNNRMQPVMIELGNTSNAAADYCLVYNYYGNVANPASCTMPTQGAGDNGNVMGVYDAGGEYIGFDVCAAVHQQAGSHDIVLVSRVAQTSPCDVCDQGPHKLSKWRAINLNAAG